MAIGRISGPMLYSNLERQGVDLAFESNILYLDVTNRWVGANTSTPNAELQVIGTANLANITISSNTISSDTGKVSFGSNANVYISGGTNNQVLLTDGAGNLSWGTVSALTTGFGNVKIAGNTISILEVDGNLELTANGTGIVTTLGYTLYAANIITTGGISGNISGVNYLLSTGVKSTGNITADYFIGNLRGTEVTTTGNITADYFIGNVTTAPGGNIAATFFTGNLDGTTVTTTGNVTAGNIIGNLYSTTVIVGGNVTANYFLGNVTTDGNVTAGNLVGNVTANTITVSNTITSNLFIGNSSTQQITATIGDSTYKRKCN
jgi:energy-converting hydrogenase Eha subunit B